MNYQNVTLGSLKDSDIVKEAFKIMFPDMYMDWKMEDSIIILNCNSISILRKNISTGFNLSDNQLERFKNLMKSIKRDREISNLGL